MNKSSGRYDEKFPENYDSEEYERKFIDKHEEIIEWLEQCGQCGQYHRPNFYGDCRDDNERFPVPFLPHPDFTPREE